MGVAPLTEILQRTAAFHVFRRVISLQRGLQLRLAAPAVDAVDRKDRNGKIVVVPARIFGSGRLSAGKDGGHIGLDVCVKGGKLFLVQGIIVQILIKDSGVIIVHCGAGQVEQTLQVPITLRNDDVKAVEGSVHHLGFRRRQGGRAEREKHGKCQQNTDQFFHLNPP